MKRWHVPAVLVVCCLLLAVLTVLARLQPPPGAALAAPRDLPPANLVDGQGRRMVLNAASGEWLLLFPGFGHCPDICPMTLSRLAAVADALLPAQVVMLSVDPERDTPPHLRQYVTHFHPRFRAWVPASGDDLRIAASALGIAFYKSINAHGYTVDHTTAMPLLAPNGQMVALYPDSTDTALLVENVRQVIATHDAARPL